MAGDSDDDDYKKGKEWIVQIKWYCYLKSSDSVWLVRFNKASLQTKSQAKIKTAKKCDAIQNSSFKKGKRCDGMYPFSFSMISSPRSF